MPNRVELQKFVRAKATASTMTFLLFIACRKCFQIYINFSLRQISCDGVDPSRVRADTRAPIGKRHGARHHKAHNADNRPVGHNRRARVERADSHAAPERANVIRSEEHRPTRQSQRTLDVRQNVHFDVVQMLGIDGKEVFRIQMVSAFGPPPPGDDARAARWKAIAM